MDGILLQRGSRKWRASARCWCFDELDDFLVRFVDHGGESATGFDKVMGMGHVNKVFVGEAGTMAYLLMGASFEVFCEITDVFVGFSVKYCPRLPTRYGR